MLSSYLDHPHSLTTHMIELSVNVGVRLYSPVVQWIPHQPEVGHGVGGRLPHGTPSGGQGPSDAVVLQCEDLSEFRMEFVQGRK